MKNALETLTQKITLPAFARADCRRHGARVAPIIALGDRPTLDVLGSARGLIPCDDWDAADFRLPIGHLDIACNVEVTGRKPIYLGERGTWVRIKVTFPGDCEPDTIVRGYGRLA